jgi:hypothetical protein
MEESSDYEATGERASIISNYNAPHGLRELASDTELAIALKINNDEWKTLGTINLPPAISKNGYVQLLITLRSIC